MTGFQRLKFKELPPEMRARLDEENFLRACVASNERNIIVWMVDRRNSARIELEWDPLRVDFIPAAERMAMLDDEYEMTLQELGGSAKVRHLLSQDTESLIEEISFYFVNGGPKTLCLSQNFYSPARVEISDLVRHELERQNFSSQYAAWPDASKVNYWVMALYRLRRSAGESGKNEDDAFGPGVVDKMRKIDPSVGLKLRTIIAGLAAMESVDATELAREFSLRTGVSL